VVVIATLYFFPACLTPLSGGAKHRKQCKVGRIRIDVRLDHRTSRRYRAPRFNQYLSVGCRAAKTTWRHVVPDRPLCVNLHLRDGRADRQTPGIEFGASVTSGGSYLNEFPDN